jgi:hypothetical protein
MSTPHRRLFEASLAALLLTEADVDEDGLPSSAPLEQWHKPMRQFQIQSYSRGSPSAEKAG